ncbi:uncharacterized protein C8Q71DRAFT_889957 [Rhodofomes roseus]|uniref:DUF6534 domain-containing protein n=1 Tax=Rhodofomes roseus TaxID=34475 RepID=A0ABQ8KQT4_9APHY|nr:uncharacterized protein C8Q71DRAFT_889957 [Rhodofomes roseus]KAH9840890.1 hypothetical protein C8Q71DRAFT_889957 [Rhodofomes roseus]
MTGLNIHLDGSVGCFFAGILLSGVLYGCTCAQVLYYIKEYPKDSKGLKLLVAFVWALDTATTIENGQVLWYFTISSHQNPAALEFAPPSFRAQYSLSAISVFVVQCHYLSTIWRLLVEKWYRLPMLSTILLISVISLACGLADVYITTSNNYVPIAFARVKIPAYLQTIAACVTDVFITIALCWILRGKRTGLAQSESRIWWLTFSMVNRGVLTAVLQIVVLVTYAALENSNVLLWLVFHFPGTQIYTNSLLAVLNVRHFVLESKRTKFPSLKSAIPLSKVKRAAAAAPDFAGSGSYSSQQHQQSVLPTVITISTDIIRDQEVHAANDTAAGYVKSTAW